MYYCYYLIGGLLVLLCVLGACFGTATEPGHYSNQQITAVCRDNYERLVRVFRFYGELDYQTRPAAIDSLARDYVRDNPDLGLDATECSVLVRRILWFNRRRWTAGTMEHGVTPVDDFMFSETTMNSALPRISAELARTIVDDILRETLIPKHLWEPRELEARLPR